MKTNDPKKIKEGDILFSVDPQKLIIVKANFKFGARLLQGALGSALKQVWTAAKILSPKAFANAAQR